MATVLDRPTTIVREPRLEEPTVATVPAGVPSAAPDWAAEDWDEADESEGPVPWGRLLFMGMLLGIGLGLPLVPFSGPILTAFAATAGALGCPFHPLPADFR